MSKFSGSNDPTLIFISTGFSVTVNARNRVRFLVAWYYRRTPPILKTTRRSCLANVHRYLSMFPSTKRVIIPATRHFSLQCRFELNSLNRVHALQQACQSSFRQSRANATRFSFTNAILWQRWLPDCSIEIRKPRWRREWQDACACLFTQWPRSAGAFHQSHANNSLLAEERATEVIYARRSSYRFRPLRRSRT